MPSYGPPGPIPTSMGPPQGMPNQGGMPPQPGSISTSPLQSPMAHMSLQSYGWALLSTKKEALIASLRSVFLITFTFSVFTDNQVFSNSFELRNKMINFSTYSKFRYPTNGGSPTMQSPMGSPLGSSLMLDERTTPMMELSPPGLHEPNTVTQSFSWYQEIVTFQAGSLPNLQQVQSNNPPTYYHQTVGQRHSTGTH